MTALRLASVVAFVATFASCGELPDVVRDAAADLNSPGDFRSAPRPTSGSSSGGAPFDPTYYARQCQWDGCGGPLPDRQTKLEPEDR